VTDELIIAGQFPLQIALECAALDLQSAVSDRGILVEQT
jgi:hypothetical protein